MVFDSFYNMAFSGLLTLNGLAFGAKLTVAVVAIVISVVISLIYKFLADQDEVKRLRAKMKNLKKEMDEAKKKNNTKEMSKLMNTSLELNNKIMKMNLKPMIVTMLAVFLILPWLHGTYDKTIDFGKEFSYLEFKENITSENGTVFFGDREIERGDFVAFRETEWEVKNIDEKNEKVRLSMAFIRTPSLPLIGNALEWLGFYILISIPATIISRKLLGVH